MSSALDPSRLADGRQSAIAADIQRGAGRLLRTLGHAVVTELPLPSGHRADLISLTSQGEIWIVEIKSCLADFRCDQKWGEYLASCDRFFFAVLPDFPRHRIPEDAGLIIADRYGAEMLRPSGLDRIKPADRKVLTLRFARAAATRLHALHDPSVLAEL